MYGSIKAIEYHLPKKILTTSDLAAEFPEWTVEKIDSKTGIHCRHIAAPHECASDLAIIAAQKLFATKICHPDQIDYLLFCTQSPDYILPTTACLLQDKLGLPESIGALDFNLGCSGFVYGLGLAESLIVAGQARNVLLITSGTYTRYIRCNDKSSRTLFGDGAAATIVSAQDALSNLIGPFIYGTSGKGAFNLIVPNSGARQAITPDGRIDNSLSDGTGHLFMNGNQIFEFAITMVPKCVQQLLEKARMTIKDVDLFVFHQANLYLLEELRKILGIPKDKFQVTISHCGNTSSSTIPIALRHAQSEQRILEGSRVMLVSFGAGYSWAATMLKWSADLPLNSPFADGPEEF